MYVKNDKAMMSPLGNVAIHLLYQVQYFHDFFICFLRF